LNTLAEQNKLEENLTQSVPSSSSEENPNDFDDQFYTVTSLDKNKFLDYINETKNNAKQSEIQPLSKTNNASLVDDTSSNKADAIVSNSIPIKTSPSPSAYKEDINSKHNSNHSSNASLNSSNNSMNDSSKLSRNPSSVYLKKLISENSPNATKNNTNNDASLSPSPSKAANKESGITSNTSSLIGFSTSFLNSNEPELKEYSGSSVSSHDDQNDSIDLNQFSASSPVKSAKETQENYDKKSTTTTTPPTPSNGAVSSADSSLPRNSSISPQSNYFYDEPGKTSNSLLRTTPTSASSKKSPQNNTNNSQTKIISSNNSANNNNIDKEKRKPWYSVSNKKFSLLRITDFDFD